jgi:hypothetical protein
VGATIISDKIPPSNLSLSSTGGGHLGAWLHYDSNPPSGSNEEGKKKRKNMRIATAARFSSLANLDQPEAFCNFGCTSTRYCTH